MKSRFFVIFFLIFTLSLLFSSSSVHASGSNISFTSYNGTYYFDNDYIFPDHDFSVPIQSYGGFSYSAACITSDSFHCFLVSSSPFDISYSTVRSGRPASYSLLSSTYYMYNGVTSYYIDINIFSNSISLDEFSNLDFLFFNDYTAWYNYVTTGAIDYSKVISSIVSSFDGSITVDNITVKNDTRYVQDLTYSVSFSGNDLVQKFESSILNSILDIGFETFYSLQVPSLSWLESTSANIFDFDYWFSLNANKSQLDVCNNFVSYTLRPADYVTDLGAAYNRQNIVANLSSYTSAIYGRSLSQTEQYLFDVLCYPRTVSVRSKWLLSSVFGYGPLKVVNIGPTRLNGDSLSYLGFDGYQVSDDSNSYDYVVEINSTSFNDTDVVISSDQNSSIEFISQDVINYNYNTYNDTINYYYGISTGSPIDVYVVNYKDFKDQVENNYIKNITRNFNINFGDLNIEPEINIGIDSGLDQIDVTVPSSSSILGKFAGSMPTDLSVLIFTFLAFGFIVAVLYHGSN